MCDSLFWQSPAADQGDLSDVVRASLQLQTPRHQAEDSSYLQLVEALGGGGGEDQQQQLAVVSQHADHERQQSMAASAACDLLHALLPPVLQQGASPRPIQELDAEEPAAELFAGAHHLHHPHHHVVPPIKRRKSQTKKVVCIPAPTAGVSGGGGEVLPSDLWAWRKYGQKPIKGSPYPRGYYRCSSSRGCSARKQVERSRADPTMLVVTYTSDHNHPWPTHRNALAGSTRPSAATAAPSSKIGVLLSSSSSHHPAHHHQSHQYDQADHRHHHDRLTTTTAPMITHLKQEDDDQLDSSDLFAGVSSMDMMISAASLLQPEQHQLGTIDSKQQLLFDEDYPHSFGFLD